MEVELEVKLDEALEVVEVVVDGTTKVLAVLEMVLVGELVCVLVVVRVVLDEDLAVEVEEDWWVVVVEVEVVEDPVDELDEVDVEEEEEEVTEAMVAPGNSISLLLAQSATQRLPEESRASPSGSARLVWLVPGALEVNEPCPITRDGFSPGSTGAANCSTLL